MKIAVFGATLQAAVMSALSAEMGHFVSWCPTADLSLFQLNSLNFDSQLNHLIEKLLTSKFLNILDQQIIDQEFDVYFFAFNPLNQDIALELVQKLSEKPIIHPKLMINGSTFGLRGTEQLQKILSKDAWVYWPDMTQDGRSIESIMQAKSIVIGIDDQGFAKTQMQEFLRPIFNRQEQILYMPILDAEFTKLSISGMLATRISYMNDMAQVAEKLNIDIQNVKQGLAADSRIGSTYLSPGVGFGGENFSHDILTLTGTVAGSGIKSQLLDQVWAINEQQKEILFRKLWNYYQGQLSGKVVAVWGASFKENTSSIDYSPIHTMLTALWAQGAIVQLHDPEALDRVKQLYGDRADLILCEDQYQASQQAHALCILTAWKQYWSPDYHQLMIKMVHPLILDGRNILNPDFVKAQGFAYQGVGRV